MKKRFLAGIAALLLVASFPALAAGGDIGNLPSILTQNLNVVADIMQTVSILMGLALFVGGMMQLKRYGEMRTMMSSQMNIWGPLMTLFAGVALLFSPLMMSTLLVSFWGPGGQTDLPFDGNTSSGWAQYIPAVLMMVRIVGVYAFMRGFVLAASTGSGHGRPGSVGRVLIHIFGGILCVHIMGTIQLIESFFGLSIPF